MPGDRREGFCRRSNQCFAAKIAIVDCIPPAKNCVSVVGKPSVNGPLCHLSQCTVSPPAAQRTSICSINSSSPLLWNQNCPRSLDAIGNSRGQGFRIRKEQRFPLHAASRRLSATATHVRLECPSRNRSTSGVSWQRPGCARSLLAAFESRCPLFAGAAITSFLCSGTVEAGDSSGPTSHGADLPVGCGIFLVPRLWRDNFSFAPISADPLPCTRCQTAWPEPASRWNRSSTKRNGKGMTAPPAARAATRRPPRHSRDDPRHMSGVLQRPAWRVVSRNLAAPTCSHPGRGSRRSLARLGHPPA